MHWKSIALLLGFTVYYTLRSLYLRVTGHSRALFFHTQKNRKIQKLDFLHSILNWLDIFHSSEVEQTVLIFMFSLKFYIPNCCLASIPNPKIPTFFRIRKVAHVQKTFFDWQTYSAVRYWWLEPNSIYRIEFCEKLENIQPVCCTDKFHTQKRAHLRPVTLKHVKIKIDTNRLGGGSV